VPAQQTASVVFTQRSIYPPAGATRCINWCEIRRQI